MSFIIVNYSNIYRMEKIHYILQYIKKKMMKISIIRKDHKFFILRDICKNKNYL